MITHFLERILSLWSTAQKKGETEGQAQAGHTRDEIVAPAVHDRRHDDRLAVGKACSFEMNESLGEQSIVLHRGEALLLNISSGGMLLLMEPAPRVRDLVEIRTSGSKCGRTLSLLEVRWTRQLLIEEHGSRYLVGCRLRFGPYSWSKRKFLEHKDLV